MLFKLAFVIYLAQFFSVGELEDSNINEVKQNRIQNRPSKQYHIDDLNNTKTVDKLVDSNINKVEQNGIQNRPNNQSHDDHLKNTKAVDALVDSYINKVEQNRIQNRPSNQSHIDHSNNTNSLDLAPADDPCPNNQSLHSRSDIKVLINFIYQQLSIDEKIRQKYQSTAIEHRDDYLKDIKQFEEWLQSHPQHFKHVLESLSRFRRDSIEPDVKKIEKLLQDNSGLSHEHEEKNKTFYHLQKKLQRYKIMCEINCEEDNDNEALDHLIFRRSIQKDYVCSSLKDLYDKIQERLLQFLENFNNESTNRFSHQDANYREKFENVTNSLREKGLQKMSGTFYEILLLQDEYHHFTEKLNFSTVLEQINLVKNLNIQVDVLILRLSQLIADYGRKCQHCMSELNFRRSRQVLTNPENESENLKEHTKSILDYLLDEKFNETAEKVQNDRENIFKEFLDVIDEIKNKHLNLEAFDKVKEEVNKMILQERRDLQSLSLSIAETLKDMEELTKLFVELIKVIQEMINELTKKFEIIYK